MNRRRPIVIAFVALAVLITAAVMKFDYESRVAMRTASAVNHPVLFTVPAGADLGHRERLEREQNAITGRNGEGSLICRAGGPALDRCQCHTDLFPAFRQGVIHDGNRHSFL